MKLKGIVKSGLGEAAFWMQKAENVLSPKLDQKMFLGTLNIELESDYILKNVITLKAEEYGGTQDIYLEKCKIFNNESYILRTDKNSKPNGDHPLNVLEIISNVNFRKEYNLQDGDTVEINI